MTRFTSANTSGPMPSPGRRRRLWVAINLTSQKLVARIAKASPQAWQPAIHGPTLSMGTNEEEPVLANARVVIIGAGFGGLEAVKTLKRAAADVIVIDRHNHHCFQPLLYQVATAALSPADIAWPIRHILRPQRNATVLMEEVHAINLQKKCLHTQYGDVHYDYLLIATAASHA